MAGNWRTKLRELFFPEWSRNSELRSTDPVDVLASVYERIVQLAEQIESHAGQAPYPHVAADLRRIADEKRQSTRQLQAVIESKRGWIQTPATQPRSGKNHWERILRDLEDQQALDSFVAAQQLRSARDSPQWLPLLENIKNSQAGHRRTLMRLLATADPQASQT